MTLVNNVNVLLKKNYASPEENVSEITSAFPRSHLQHIYTREQRFLPFRLSKLLVLLLV